MVLVLRVLEEVLVGIEAFLGVDLLPSSFFKLLYGCIFETCTCMHILALLIAVRTLMPCGKD